MPTQVSLPFTAGLDSSDAPPAMQSPAAPVHPHPSVPPAWETQEIVFVRHQRAIRVHQNGSVRVTIPRGGSKREAAAFAERQRVWIADQRCRLAREREELRALEPDESRALRLAAKRQLTVRLLELAQRFGLAVAKVSVRNQRWRWGSCSRDGHVCLNWRLVQMPAWVRDYVLVHELMHLKRMDHSPAFWKLVAAACPDYQQARGWLREHGHGLAEG
jgi:predicted metal-dependent hydrolase